MLSSSFPEQHGNNLQGENQTFYQYNLRGSENFEPVHPFSKSKPKTLDSKVG